MTTMTQEKERENDQEKTRWRVVLYDFTQNTTIHALKQIAEPTPFTLRRVIWILILALGLVAFIMQVTESIIYYMSNPVAVNIMINYNDTLRFPAVTICNQNAFRMTKASEQGYYDAIEGLFGHDHIEHLSNDTINEDYAKVLDTPMSQMYMNLSHRQEDFIVSCKWEQQPCSADDFEQTLTDHGVCYTFNNAAQLSEVKNATQTGALWGLRLRINVEQYEYMMGPNDGAGVRVLVHEQKDFALVGDFGQSVPPGLHAFLGIMIVEIHDLPAPHGKCEDDVALEHFDHYTQAACTRECKQKMVRDACACSLGVLPQDAPEHYHSCTVREHLDCVTPTLNTFRDYHGKCSCPYPCDRTHFDADITYGDMSKFDMEKILYGNATLLANRYAFARETSQVVKKEIVEKDKSMAGELALSVSAISDILTDIPVKLNKLMEIFNEDAAKFKQKIWFHLNIGLKKVEYVAKHDFVRGWEIVEERTFNHVATGFWEVVSSYDRALDLLSTTYNDAEVIQRDLMWHNIDDRLFNRLTMAQRALVNLTEVNNAYKTGDPLLKFRVTLDRRYDLFFIPVHLFNLRPITRQKYFAGCESELLKYITAIQEMRSCGARLVARNVTSCADLPINRDKFIKSAKMINYNLFLFRTKVLEKPAQAVGEIITHFVHKNETLWAEYNFLRGLIEKVTQDVRNFADSTWLRIKTVSQMYSNYTLHRATLKSSLAAILNSHTMEEDMIVLQHFFLNLRSRSREIKDSSLRLRDIYIETFQMMADEESTKVFYTKVYNDILEYFENPTNASDYVLQFAALTKQSDSYIRERSKLSLMRLMNADFHDMNVTASMIGIIEFFSNELLLRAQIDETVNNLDDVLKNHLREIRENLATFTASTKIGFDFFRENYLNLDIYMRALSYEGITQQIAYDMTNLWSDIGGSIGLFIGASAISVFEILDIFLHTGMMVARDKNIRKKRGRADQMDYTKQPNHEKNKETGWMFSQSV